MPNEESLQNIHNSALINELSILIFQAIIPILQQHPELVVAKHQSINWNETRYQFAILTDLNRKLGSTADPSTIETTVKQYLKNLLVRSFFDSPDFQRLETRIRSFIHSQSNDVQELNNAIALLLLDVENLRLNTEIEKFLRTVCTYPIQVKIAFANWCSMGKLDVQLHQRGYDLIHVPAGRDNADGKMIAFGSSIHERYPNTKEVLVCSSDKVMTNLCNHLQQNGLRVYRVSKQREHIEVFNSSTGEILIKSLPSSSESKIPTIEELILQLKNLIKIEQKHSDNYWIKLSTISQAFKTKYKLSISQVVAKHLPGKKARDIFFKYPTEFVVHQIDEVSELYIALFEINSFLLVDAKVATQLICEQEPLLSMINSKADLETVLKNLIDTLIIESPSRYVNVGILSSKFNQKYGKPITAQLKSLQISSKFLKFLHSCSSLELQQSTKGWEVAVR